MELDSYSGMQENITGNEVLQSLRGQLTGSIFSVNIEMLKIYDRRNVYKRQWASCLEFSGLSGNS